MEELQAKHRKEQRDLQSRITQKKKQATKKTRKGVNDECEQLERELKERQQREISNLSGLSDGAVNAPEDTPEAVADDLQDLSPNPPPDTTNGVSKQVRFDTPTPAESPTQVEAPQSQQRKPNRAKARLARRAAEQEAIAAKAASEAADLPNLREQERQRMLEEFKKLGLTEKVIRADGHCLYSAVADQMAQLGLELMPGEKGDVARGGNGEVEGYRSVRYAAAGYMEGHRDDFEPFMDEPVEKYLHKVKDTGEWGGQLELQALAKTYGVEINVVQGNGRIEKIEPGQEVDKDKKIWLAYYRHGFGLGEHYNSLRRAP